jgi:cytochrome c biogenesis protein CcmG/thiol:disulfide interchange protein DsbE
VSAAAGPTGGPTDRRRLPRAWYLAAALLPLLLLAAWAGWLLAGSDRAGAQVGDQAPDFTLTDLDGNQVRLADLRGRPVLVNFWATWCVPCVAEFPLLVDAQREHAAAGLAVIGVVYNDNAEAARQFMVRFEAPWPAVMDPDGTVARRYGIFGPPESFFIGRDGKVLGRQIGELNATDLQRQLAAILDEE